MEMMLGKSAILVLAILVAACFGAEGDISGSGPLTTVQRQMIVDKHNEYRRIEGASDMLKMEYDMDLEKYAQAHADRCTIDMSDGHAPGFGGVVGEIRYLDDSPFPATQPVVSWMQLKSKYNMSASTCSKWDNLCGIYTQVVSARTSKVGCGVAYCDRLTETGWGGWGSPAYVLFCNYYPAGNWLGPIQGTRLLTNRYGFTGQLPFTAGPKCSACPSTAPACNNDLCS